MKGRGIENVQEWLDSDMRNVARWGQLAHMEDAVKMVYDTIRDNGNIQVVVDCDMDGFGSAAIFINYFTSIDKDWAKEHIDFILHEGKAHGLSDIYDLVKDDTALVVCPDAASNDIEYHKMLNERGIKFLALDHHIADEDYTNLPDSIVVNNQLCGYPNKTAVGGVITWQFCRAYDDLLGYNYSDNFLDLCALTLVSDMASLKDLETIALVREGSKRISNPFFQEMCKKNQYTMQKHGGACPMGFAFAVVPMVNAICRTGELEEKKTVFKSFCDLWAYDKVMSEATRGDFKGQRVPLYCEGVRVANSVKYRQNKIQDEVMATVEQEIQENNLLENAVLTIVNKPGIIPGGVAGLVANKLQAKYQRPAMVLTENETEDGVMCNGSMRNYSMSEQDNFKKVLEDTKLVEYVHGHNNAAGCGLKKERIPALTKSLNDSYKNVPKEPVYWVDYEWGQNEIDENTILTVAGFDRYWGQDIPESLIAVKGMDLSQYKLSLCGKNMDTLRIVGKDGFVFVRFGVSQEDFDKMQENNAMMDCVCSPQRNEWQGKISGEFIIKDYTIRKEWVF